MATGTYPQVLYQLHHTKTTPLTTMHGCGSGETVWISASSFMRAVKEVRPAVVLKHDMFSLLVDSNGSAPGQGPGQGQGRGQGPGQRSSLVCVEGLQDRLRTAVLLPYLQSKVPHRSSAHSVGGCSGKNSLSTCTDTSTVTLTVPALTKAKHYNRLKYLYLIIWQAFSSMDPLVVGKPVWHTGLLWRDLRPSSSSQWRVLTWCTR